MNCPDNLCVWGVDPSTKRIAIAWTGAEPGVRTLELPELRGGERLAWLETNLRSFAAGLMTEDSARVPAAVWVEQPFAVSHVEPKLYYAVGVTMSALSAAVQCFNPDSIVEDIPVPTWKSLALGNGAAPKPLVLAWAQSRGYEGQCCCLPDERKCKAQAPAHDEADAIAIAHAALKQARVPVAA